MEFTDWLRYQVQRMEDEIRHHPQFNGCEASSDELQQLRRTIVLHTFLRQQFLRREVVRHELVREPLLVPVLTKTSGER